MKKVIFSTLVIFALTILSSYQVFACSCLPASKKPLATQVKTAKSESDAVFTGTVLKIVEGDGYFNTQVKIKVINVWKGKLSKQITILTGNDDGFCRYHFEVGETYLVYAHMGVMGDSSERRLETTICTRTRLFSDAEADIEILGKSRRLRKN